MRRVGIDVGGTNTDAVLLEASRVVAAVKRPTTEDVTTGITNALSELVASTDLATHAPQAVMVGTTHFTNAVVQRHDLVRVAAIRIGLPASASLPPFVDWPQDLADAVRGPTFLVEGGHEYDGRPIVPFDADAVRRAADAIAEGGVRSVGITSVFSPLTAECEERAAAIVRERCPTVTITESHRLGRIGLLERENATLLNGCLVDLAGRTTAAFEAALGTVGIDAPLYLTQNDGTVMHADYARRFPVYSFASGPTNSMRGAAFLSGLEDAMVVDVGGTTTDVGYLRAGFPREANSVVNIGGVRTLFRMPDVLSVGLGGGSIVRLDAGSVGPESVGYRLTQAAVVYGGDTVTATDLAVQLGIVGLGDAERVRRLDGEMVRRCWTGIEQILSETVDRMRSESGAIPLVAVGGGAFLVPEAIEGISEVVRVDHAPVANAVGAAIAQVSGQVDRIFSDVDRNTALAQAERLAFERAVASGAEPESVVTVEVEDLPVSYLPGNARRVRARAVGDIRAHLP